MSDVVGDWIAGFSSLDPHRPPQIPGLGGWCKAWPKIHAYTIKFLREHGDEASEAGFGCLSLLGVHREAGAMRMDSTGALITYRPVTIVAIAPKLLRFSNGNAYRGQTNPAASVPIWEFRAPDQTPRKR